VHTIRLIDVRTRTSNEVIAQERIHPLADLYLLRSPEPQALDLALYLEQCCALVINTYASTLLCQDRVQMTQYMQKACLPWPITWSFLTLGHLLTCDELFAVLSFPVIIKSHYNHRGELVDKIDTIDQLRKLGVLWNKEPIILQKFLPNDGWDIKLWVIDQQVFAARRRTTLEAGVPKKDFPFAKSEIPYEWIRIALEVGRSFDLRIYGIDLVITEQGPVAVDVNAFPNFQGVPSATNALVALVEDLSRRMII